MIRRELTEISQRHSGQLKSLNPTNGSAVLQFPSLEQARDMASGVLRLQKENSGVNSLKLFSVKKTETNSCDEGKSEHSFIFI